MVATEMRFFRKIQEIIKLERNRNEKIIADLNIKPIEMVISERQLRSLAHTHIEWERKD